MSRAGWSALFKPKSTEGKRIRIHLLELLGAGLVAFFLTLIDAGQIRFLKPFAAPTFIIATNFTEATKMLPDHEVFLENHFGNHKTHILLIGSCELESVWTTSIEKVDARFSIASYLQRDFLEDGKTHVRVINASLPLMVTGNNLHLFLRFLEDPRYPIFIWHNEFNSTDIKKNRLRPDPFLFQKLSSLRHRFPAIHEIDETLAADFKQPAGTSPRVVEPDPPVRSETTSWADLVNAFADTFRVEAHHGRFSTMQDALERHTRFLRGFDNRLPELLNLSVRPPTDGLDPIDWGPDIQQWYGPRYAVSEESRLGAGVDLNQDNTRTLRLMGKLADHFHKRLYVYFGPEGRAANQVDSVYTRLYKNPILAAIKGLPAVRVMDFTDLEVTEGVDLFNNVNVSYRGSEKVAKKMFEILRHDNDFPIL